MIIQSTSEKKQRLIDFKISEPLQVGEEIYIKYNAGNKHYFDKERANQTKKVRIINLDDVDNIIVQETQYNNRYIRHRFKRFILYWKKPI